MRREDLKSKILAYLTTSLSLRVLIVVSVPKSTPYLSLAQVAAELIANPHTLKGKFRELLAHGLIEASGKERGAHYVGK